jgi:branched-chain amino acid transport system ATP-binding protein
MSETPFLRLDGITKAFSGTPVLVNLDLSVRAGERRGLIGPNGAGKTTLINVITGAHQPDAGDILFRGKSIRRLLPHRRNRLGISRSFQILSLFGEMTVGENIRNAVLRYRGLHVSPRRLLRRLDSTFAEVAAVAEMVGLGRALQERADNLPYGMQRRLDIALVLAQRPELIILDEPAAGLSAAETRDLIAVLQATIGKRTLILVEHDMDVVYALSDRITVLDYGQVLTEGTPAEINTDPNVRRVYLGEEAA